jgi:hypothetical protein
MIKATMMIKTISEPVETYMVVNFRIREINRVICKLVRISMLIKKKPKKMFKMIEELRKNLLKK